MALLYRILLLAVTGSLLLACDAGGSEPVELTRVQTFMQDPAALVRGEALFVGTCAGYCHTLPGEPTDDAFLFDCDWTLGGSDDEIFAVITSGIPGTRMVGFGENFPEGEDDKWKIIAYLRANQEPCE